MKKLLLILIGLFMVIGLAGCGGPTAKEEATQFNATYFEKEFRGEITPATREQDSRLRKQYPNNPPNSPDAAEISSKLSAFIDKLKNVKIHNKEVEPLKEAFIKYMTAYSNSELSMAANDANDVRLAKNTEVLQRKFDYIDECSKLTTGHSHPLMTIHGYKYYAGVASDVVFAIISVKESDKVGSGYFEKKAQGKFIEVYVMAYNGQKDAVTIDSSCFHLIDKEGRQFSTSSQGMSAIQTAEGHTKGFLSQANPTMTVDATYVFDVPQDTKFFDYKLEARGGMTGDKVIMDLRNTYTGYKS